jgi:membrane protein DedA with SNARE-associated domain
MGLGFAVVTLTVAGMLKVPFKNYFLLNLFGGFIWTAFLITLGYFFGNFYVLIPIWAKVLSLIFGLMAFISALYFANKYLVKQDI